ncbi:MAG: GAF domain-containing protein [Chloroflexota bacterium]
MPDPKLTTDPASRDTARRLEELTFLADVAKLAASARTFEELMGTILDRTRAAARADVCSIYLMDRDRSGLTLAATDGLDQEAVGRARLALGEGLTGLAAHQRATVTSVDVNVDPRFAWIREVDQARYTSMCSVPMLWGDQVVGVLNVQTVDRRVFEDADLRFLETLAGLLAGMVEKQRLQRDAVAQLEALRAIDEARANLIAVVTHALRTPLAVVRAYVELLGGRAQVAEQPDAALWESEALTQVDRLDRTVDSILESLRVFPSARVDLARIDLAATVREETRIIAPMLRRHELATTFTSDPLYAWASDETRQPGLLGYLLENASTRRWGSHRHLWLEPDGVAHLAHHRRWPRIPREWRDRSSSRSCGPDDSSVRGAGNGRLRHATWPGAMSGDLRSMTESLGPQFSWRPSGSCARTRPRPPEPRERRARA